jgi:SagB-type dehydrogenase family enzyme
MRYKNFSKDFLKSHFEENWTEWLSDSKKGIARPPKQKDLLPKDKIIDLIQPEQFDFNITLLDAIKKRRSHRRFTQNFLSLKELSFLLWSTQGITDGSNSAHRAVPSANACHPFETYLLIKKVTDLQPGIYRYLLLDHKLCLVSNQEDAAEKMATSCFKINQPQLHDAAVVFIWAAVPYRSEWRFGPYAYKFIALDVGHICENLYLAAGAINTGGCAIAVYDQKAVDNIIGVNGNDEFAIYLATIGKLE